MGRVPSPAPTYSSVYDSKDASFGIQHSNSDTAFTETAPYNPYQQSTFHESSASSPRSHSKAPLDNSPVIPDYEDPNHPHYAAPSNPSFAARIPRGRLPSKRILIPWVLATLFFTITIWYTSILAGSRFLSILHPLPTSPTVQEIHIIINGQTMSIATPTITSQTSEVPTTTVQSSSQGPTTTRLVLVPVGIVPPSDNTGNNQGSSLQNSKRGIRHEPTTFVTAIKSAH